MVDSMVERVALAISGGDDPADILAIHRTRARAAIAAMREPTGAMVEAVERFEGAHPTTSWKAMIDEAVK